jgi:hypothetical protein
VGCGAKQAGVRTLAARSVLALSSMARFITSAWCCICTGQVGGQPLEATAAVRRAGGAGAAEGWRRRVGGLDTRAVLVVL